MKLPDREIPAEMERVLARLGGGWQLTTGAADAELSGNLEWAHRGDR